MLLMANARSSERAMPAMVRPGLSGDEMPIAPASRTTGTTGISLRKRAGMSGPSIALMRCIGVTSDIGNHLSLPLHDSFIVNTAQADFAERQNRLGVIALNVEPIMKLLFLFVLMTSIVLAAHPGALIRGSLMLSGRRAAA